MPVSVLIPYRSNGDHLRDANFEVVRRSWEYLIEGRGEVVVSEGDDGELFNRSGARNAAFRESTGDTLIIADADTLFLPELVNEAIDWVEQGRNQWVLPYTRYYNATMMWSANYRRAFGKGPWFLVGDDEPDITYEHVLPGATSGVIVLTREAFIRVGGYDERFIGWGWEDLAFSCSLGALCGPLTRLDGFVVHLFHRHDHADNFGQPFEPHNRALYERYYAAEHDKEALDRLIKEHNSCV